MDTLMAYLKSLYLRLCGLAQLTREAAESLWDFVREIIFLNLICIVLLVACLLTRNKMFAYIIALASSILIILTWYAGKIFTQVLNGLSKRPSVNATVNELSKLLNPLCTLSLLMAFVAFWVGIEGYRYITNEQFIIIFATVFFFAILMVYLGKNSKLAGKLMMALVIFMLLQKAFPEQYRWITRAMDATSQYAGSEADRYSVNRQADAKATYAFVVDNGVFYHTDGYTPTDIKARVWQKVLVLDIKDDIQQSGGEPMVAIRLPDSNGAFVANTPEYKFPRSKLSEFKMVSDFSKLPPPPQRTVEEKIVHFEPAKPTDSLLTVQKGDTVRFIGPTAKFKVFGGGRFYEISSTTDFNADGNGSIAIFGCQKEGFVQVKIIPGV